MKNGSRKANEAGRRERKRLSHLEIVLFCACPNLLRKSIFSSGTEGFKVLDQQTVLGSFGLLYPYSDQKTARQGSKIAVANELKKDKKTVKYMLFKITLVTFQALHCY